MAIDLITGHQGVAHISAEQIANINNALMDDYGVDKVVRLDDGTLTQDGLTINVGTGFWRVNGFDMEVQEAETIYIDPTAAGLSRIDNIYVEILQDIPTGAQRSEIVTVNGEPSATPTAPEAPTAPELNTDILLQVVPLASVTVTEGAMVMTDLSVAYEMVTPSELEAVETIATGAQEAITDIVNVYGAKNLIPYPYYYTTITTNGITWTDNGDGTITANGTSSATATSFFHLYANNNDLSSYMLEPNTTYTLSLELQNTTSMSIYVNINGSDIAVIRNKASGYYETTFTTPTSFTTRLGIGVYTSKNVTYSNAIIKPMIRLASIQDDTWVPYVPTNKELTDIFTNQVANKDDAYSSSKAYSVGDHVIYNNKVYKCITACSVGSWATNQSCFKQTTLTGAVSELNSSLNKHTFDTSVSLQNYTSTNYEVPCDGYVKLTSPSTLNGRVTLHINDVATALVRCHATNYPSIQSIYVKKGMLLKHDANDTLGEVIFYPLK